MKEKIFSPKEVAYKLHISYTSVMRFIKKKKLQAYKIGRHYKIYETDLNNFLLQNNNMSNIDKENQTISSYVVNQVNNYLKNYKDEELEYIMLFISTDLEEHIYSLDISKGYNLFKYRKVDKD